MENIICKKTFKDYYNDSDYKKKHNVYMCAKIKCKCGCDVARANLSTHKKTKKHQKIVNEIEKIQNQEINDKILQSIISLEQKISELKNNIKK